MCVKFPLVSGRNVSGNSVSEKVGHFHMKTVVQFHANVASVATRADKRG